MLINDDISAFTDISARLGRAAADFEADFLASKLTANPKMSDGKAVFHADHGNLGSGALFPDRRGPFGRALGNASAER